MLVLTSPAGPQHGQAARIRLRHVRNKGGRRSRGWETHHYQGPSGARAQAKDQPSPPPRVTFTLPCIAHLRMRTSASPLRRRGRLADDALARLVFPGRLSPAPRSRARRCAGAYSLRWSQHPVRSQFPHRSRRSQFSPLPAPAAHRAPRARLLPHTAGPTAAARRLPAPSPPTSSSTSAISTSTPTTSRSAATLSSSAPSRSRRWCRTTRRAAAAGSGSSRLTARVRSTPC